MIALLACIAAEEGAPADTAPPAAAVLGTDSAEEDTSAPLVIAPPADDCGLTADLATPWLWEGDEVVFSVACTDGSDATITAAAMPAGARFEGGTFTWQSGPADGGRVEVVFAVQTEREQIPAAATVTLWLADNPALPDAVPVDPLTYTEEWGLPVIHIDVEGALSESYQTGTVTMGGVPLSADVKIRGASSASYPKNSYTLAFNEQELSIPAWGVTRDHLILVTTFDDNSYVRQKLVYDLWAAISAGSPRLTPRTFFAVVYMGTEYHGLYVALDRIDNEFVRQQGFADTGNLYKAVNHDANFYLTGSDGYAKDTLHDGYTKKEGEDESDLSDLEELVSFTGSADAAALVDGLADWVEPEEMMDWFILVYFALAEDSAGKNAYLYHDPDSDRFLYAPWDFNHAWGQNWYTLRLAANYLNDYQSTNRIFWAQQSADADTLASRFAALIADGPLNESWLDATVDAYYAEIDPSAARDWEKWGAEYTSYSRWAPYRSDWTDFEGEKDYLYLWIEERAGLLGDLYAQP